jgi:hypothetical protein
LEAPADQSLQNGKFLCANFGMNSAIIRSVIGGRFCCTDRTLTGVKTLLRGLALLPNLALDRAGTRLEWSRGGYQPL